jgi:hypothetical protein
MKMADFIEPGRYCNKPIIAAATAKRITLRVVLIETTLQGCNFFAFSTCHIMIRNTRPVFHTLLFFKELSGAKVFQFYIHKLIALHLR